MRIGHLAVSSLFLASLAATSIATQSTPPITADALRSRAWSANVVMPQSRAFHVDASQPAVRVSSIRADVLIVDGIATTTLDVRVENSAARDSQAELLLPVPEGAVVSGFDFEGKGASSSAVVLPRDQARETYDSIVARLADPALLEFVGSSLVRSSVFPVPHGGSQTVRVRYEHVLPVDGSRLDYELPRSESLSADVQWDVKLEVRSTRPIADVYSPTHDLPRVEGNSRRVVMHARPGTPMQAGSLHVSVLLADGPVTTTLFTSADPDGAGGWFLLLAGLGEPPPDAAIPQREVTIVLDRSGSMAGEKFDQARAAALQVIEGLAWCESIQIIDYSDKVERFAPAAVEKSPSTLPALRAYLAGLRTGGSTNLDGALEAALATPPTGGKLPVVLFLTDGLPTVGITREVDIRARLERENVHARRVFTFGVGNDVNAPLLDSIAVKSRARSTYIRPSEDVERAVASVFSALAGPVVTDLAMRVTGRDGAASTRLTRDLYPQMLPDLFRGDRLILVGRYLADGPARFELTGTRAGTPSRWTMDYDFARALPRNEFVKRLWAMRRIAALEDELRTAGADPKAIATLRDDVRYGEIIKEMLDLATRFGVLTDSTAFLALEGTKLGDSATLVATAEQRGFDNANCRTGLEGVAAQQNVGLNREQTWVNFDNTLYAANGEAIANRTVQSMRGRTYFRRGATWVDGQLALADDVAPDRVVTIGTPEHAALVDSMAKVGCAAQLALEGEILLRHEGENVLVKPQAAPASNVEQSK